MRAAPGRMHIDNASRQYATASGEQRTSRCYLLRRSFRDEQGRPRNETLANLSALPDHVLGALGRMLAGATLVDAGEAFEVERAVRPESKLSTAGWWAAGDTTLGTDLGVADASTDDIYAAMDWLASRQRGIEKQLAARHLAEGGIAMFDLSSSWVEGSCCELAAYGYSRDGRRGRKQI